MWGWGFGPTERVDVERTPSDMVDTGSGPAMVLILGIQGRCEWMDAAVDALSARRRVITDSLPHDICDGGTFGAYVDWVDDLMDRAQVSRAALCGVSYGGLVALHHAARRPDRVMSLTLASTPSFTWQPNTRVEWYLKMPRLLSPVFALSSPFRLYPEIASAFPDPFERAGFALRHLHRVTRYPFAPSRMAARVRLLQGVDFADDCRRVTMPTHVVTGQPGLDRVVPVESTRAYLDVIDGATHTQLDATRHIGLGTRPDTFAEVVGRFIETHAARPHHRGRVPA
jgi:pimeloyl-ACP methyl ester carboxylesterase